MGAQDLQKLFEIKNQIQQIDKKNYYNFIIDSDTKEGRTRIIIDEFGTWKKMPNLTEEQASEYRKNAQGEKLEPPKRLNFMILGPRNFFPWPFFLYSEGTFIRQTF